MAHLTIRRKNKKNKLRLNNRLLLIRSRKLLVQLLAILDLFEDAREKIEGEYIFDRRYVFSLIDDVLEITRMLIVTLSIMEPDSSSILFPLMDQIKTESLNFFRADNDRPCLVKVKNDLLKDEEPEYRLLNETLAWLADDESGRLKKIVRTVIDIFVVYLDQHYVGEIEPVVPCSCGMFEQNLYLCSLEYEDIEKQQNIRTCSDIVMCKPLELLCMGSYNSVTDKEYVDSRQHDLQWEGIADYYHVLLLASNNNILHLLLHCTFSSETTDNYLMIFHRTNSALALPPDLLSRNIETSNGFFSWISSLNQEEVEQKLLEVGKHLMDSSIENPVTE